MSDLPDDIDEKAIREAPKEEINRWVATRDPNLTITHLHTDDIRWRYKEPGSYERDHADPPPYTSEWWAAGPLLEELQGLVGAEPMEGKSLLVTDGQWCAVSVFKGHGSRPVGRDSPDAIARAYLLAAHRGLLEPDD